MTCNIDNAVNIVISGVGGQGVLTLAEILAKSALSQSYNVRVGEIHGMAQRGGHVVCTVRIGKNAYGPVVDAGTAQLLIGFEPIETLREIQTIAKDGHVLMNSHILYPVAVSMGQVEYPKHEEIVTNIKKFTNNLVEIDAMKLAIQAGSSRSLNMVMFGGLIGTGIIPISEESALKEIRNAFPKKFEIVNTTAFQLGLQAVQSVSQ
ncbi:MAG: indolepyruvate ferredoxin oxidoreductase subunit beta [Candidatus Thorarchaeota archaeon]|nr:indolepyruvate ferredoxin oxidoreductase subunit beta [Candidatus Thorarchaeota archaeon]